jgi:hypothetical protein
MPLEDIPSQEIDIIKQVISGFYDIHEPQVFQLQAIHYLDNPSLALLCRATDGKTLVPLSTSSILRCGITLFWFFSNSRKQSCQHKVTVLNHDNDQ